MSPEQNIRLGGQRRQFPWSGKKLSRKTWMVICGSCLLVVAFISMIIQLLSPEEGGQGTDGCSDSSDCPEGLLCAAGGCVVLLANEFPNVWAEDIALQLDTDPETPKWSLPPSFGEKLLEAKDCSVPEKKVEPFDEGRILPIRQVRIFDLGAHPMKVYRYLRSRGSIWVGALRFWLDDGREPAPETICVSRGITAVSKGLGHHQGVQKAYVDGELARAAPAEVDVKGSISYRATGSPADAERFRTLSFDLSAAIVEEQRFYTVVGVPLGFDVSAIEGRAPSFQRLLTGYIAYYWEHGKTRSHVDFRCRDRGAGQALLNISEVNP